MIAKQISVFLENKPGVLAEVCKSLTEKNVNIIGFSISDTVDYAVVRLVVDNTSTATHILGEGGALVVETEVLALKLENRPGTLEKVAAKLAEAKVNIEYAYGSGDGKEGTVFLRVSDLKKAQSVLGK
jgi:hypothetical protein